MAHHVLKVHPQFWDALKSGAMPFQVRLNDRKFSVGDVLRLRKYDPAFGLTADPAVIRTVTHVLAHEDFPNGVPRGYVVLGFGTHSGMDDGK